MENIENIVKEYEVKNMSDIEAEMMKDQFQKAVWGCIGFAALLLMLLFCI